MATRTRSADPTRTKSIRRQYARRLRGGFSRINTVIREAVADRDIFGLGEPNALFAAAPPGDFRFTRDDRKVDGFTDWLEQAQADEVLTIIDRGENRYVRQAYERGVKTAHADLRRAGVDIDAADLGWVINQPVHEEKLQALYTRNFRELQGITEAVDQQVSRELTDALLEGVNPRETADRITDRVDSIGKTRATVLARTETLNAHNEAALSRYEQILGPEAEVELQAEIITAGDDRLCDICEPRHGETMALSDARRDGPPFHPQCRCTFAPVVRP